MWPIVGLHTAPSPVLYMSDITNQPLSLASLGLNMSGVTNQPLLSFLLNLRSLLTAVPQAAIIHSIELAHSKWKDVLNQIRLRHCVNGNEKGQAQGGALVSMLFNLYFLVWDSWRNPELGRPRAHLGCGVETCQGAPSCVPVHSSEKGGEAGWASGAGHNPGLFRLRRKRLVSDPSWKEFHSPLPPPSVIISVVVLIVMMSY